MDPNGADARTDFENRQDPRNVKPEKGDTVEVCFFRTGPSKVIEGEVVAVYRRGRFAIQIEGEVPHGETWIVHDKELRSGNFREGFENENGHVSFVGVF